MNKFISAFPGCGKSTVFWNAHKYHMYSLNKEGTAAFRKSYREGQTYLYDSDSSTFDKAHFPQNYIDHMKEVIMRHAGENEFNMFVSSHSAVRKAMQDAGIIYTLVYPDRSLKDEYIKRYIDRNSPPALISLMEANWDVFIDSCEEDPAYNKIVLQSGKYIGDIL